ncbi:MAG: transcription elongation factor GreA [Candidatus Paceibacteria bacterium]|jgi:transcription elongation factor GreA
MYNIFFLKNLNMKQNKEYLTKQKHEELQLELKELQFNTRRTVAEQLEYAKSLGDLSENAEYQEARENQAKIEARISQVENILKNAEIVSHKKGDVAQVGSLVKIKKVKGGDEAKDYVIVGSEEADLSVGKISHQSPLGDALIGKKTGDTFMFESPKGKVEYKIVSVE